MIVDAAGNVVARIKGGPGRVKQLAAGYSLQRRKGGAFRPQRLGGGDWTYGGHAQYAISQPEELTGWEQYGGHARYDVVSPHQLTGDEGMFGLGQGRGRKVRRGWEKYGGHSYFEPSVKPWEHPGRGRGHAYGRTAHPGRGRGHAYGRMRGLGVDRESGGPGLPMRALDKLALQSSSATAAQLSGDEGMFGPEGEASALF